MLIYWCSFNWTIVSLCSSEVLKIKRTLLLIDYIYSLYKLNRKRYFIGGYTSLIGVFEGKIGTRVNTQTPFTIFERSKTCTDPPFLYMRPAGTVQVF